MTESETPNHRENWSNTELIAIVGSVGLAGIETAALAIGQGVTRSYSLIIMAGVAVLMTIAGRRHRRNAENWKYIAQDRGDDR